MWGKIEMTTKQIIQKIIAETPEPNERLKRIRKEELEEKLQKEFDKVKDQNKEERNGK